MKLVVTSFMTLDRMPKYLVSNTLKRADWSNSTIISGDISAEVRKLKAQPGGDMLVYGSPDLVDATTACARV